MANAPQTPEKSNAEAQRRYRQNFAARLDRIEATIEAMPSAFLLALEKKLSAIKGSNDAPR